MIRKIFEIIDNFVTWQTIGWATKYYKIKAGDTILDIGGYFGGFAIYASKKVGKSGKVFCFEPDPRNWEILERKIKNGKINNIILIKKAVSNKRGKVTLTSNFSFSSIVQQSQKNGVLVEAITLDDELSNLNINKINLVKMNIEGAEIEAIEGARKALTIVKNIVIASHNRNNKDTADMLKTEIERLGFKTNISCYLHKNLYGSK